MHTTRIVVAVIVLAFASLSETQTKFDWASTHASKTLGVDFVSPEDVTRVNGFIYTETQLEELAKTIPSSRIDVGWLKRGHYILMPAPPEPMSLSAVRGVHSDSDEGDKTSFGWLAIKKEAVPKSAGKPWHEQLKLLSSNERVPNAAELVWYVNTYFKVRGVRLFERIFVRSSSLDTHDKHVVVGFFTDDDPKVCGCTTDGADSIVGIAAAGKRK